MWYTVPVEVTAMIIRTRIILMALLLIGLACCATACQPDSDKPAEIQTETQIQGEIQTEEQEEEQLEVRLLCLNIGKADCMLLMWEDQAYLIDAGYAQTYAALETALAQNSITHLNGVFLTHCHKDHDGGLYALAMSDVQVDAWYAPAIYYALDADGHSAQIAAAVRNQEVTWLNAGDVIDAGSGCSFTVLGPLTVNEDNENNNSLVMRFASPAGSILFGGDMKEEEEYELLAANAFTACDVLKVGHHGDNKTATAAMLSVVMPKVSLIMTNSWEETDTPANSTIKRLNAVGSAVYVSQNAHDAILVTLKNGGVTVDDVIWEGIPAAVEGLTLEMNLTNDSITIRNEGGDTVALTGYVLYSIRGDENLTLPECSLAPGDTLVIGTKTTKGTVDVKWDDKKVWHQTKRDVAILYDLYGRGVARTDNGMEE